MRNIDQNLLDSLSSEEYRPCILLFLTDIEQELRYTTWDYPVSYNSQVFNPRGMEIGSIKYGTSSVVESVSAKIDDVDRTMYSFLTSPTYGIAGATVSIAVLDNYGQLIGASDVFSGEVSEWSYSPANASLRISSIFVQWSTVTTKVFSGSCRWSMFKGVECKYTGVGRSCDRTYKQCEEYSNTDNFGGFRWIHSLEDKNEVKTQRPFSRWPTGSGESV